MTWLVGGVLLVIDKTGNATIFQSGEVRDKIPIDLRVDEQIRTVDQKGNGFVIAGSLGSLAFYEACGAR